MVAPDERLYQDLVSSLKNQLDFGKSEIVGRILTASLAAVDPSRSVSQVVEFKKNVLTIGNKQYSINTYNRIFVVSIGKAAGQMAQAIENILGPIVTSGIVVQKQALDEISFQLPDNYVILQGNHPVPEKGSLDAGRAIIEFLKPCKNNDLVLFLISGGGSALVTLPRSGIELYDLQFLTQSLLKCGASINEINTVRKHLDWIKGGGLAKEVYPAEMVTLILSDVIDNPLDMIASGPTVPDPTTFLAAKGVLNKYQLLETLPSSISKVLTLGIQGKLPETGKINDACFKDFQSIIIGSIYQAALAGLLAAEINGFNAQILSTFLKGQSFPVGSLLGSVLRQIADSDQPICRPACLIAGGETTVVVRGDGLGGRNQEVALGAVDEIDGLENVAFITLATDGEDGPTDAAGACVTGETKQLALDYGLVVEDYYFHNDSYNFFDPINALIQTGSTGTNVNDLVFMFAF